ncbi:MAG TPA: hypothetical protein VN088_06230 [Nocardioides sp.]|nr:hypothetical protein [Nocardioides sp.]
MSTTPDTHDRLAIAENNLLDGRAYETLVPDHLLFPNDLREGDVITDGIGVYQVDSVDTADCSGAEWAQRWIRHIRIRHTIVGPIMGGLLRGDAEYVRVLARRRIEG